MLPLMLNLYVGQLGPVGAQFYPAHRERDRQPSRPCRGALQGRHYLTGTFSGADIQKSFVGEMAKSLKKLEPFPALAAGVERLPARPAFRRSAEKGGAFRFG